MHCCMVGSPDMGQVCKCLDGRQKSDSAAMNLALAGLRRRSLQGRLLT
jgi:hypothetical protein